MKYLKILYYCLVFTCCYNRSVATEATIRINPSAVNPHRITNILNGAFIDPIKDWINGPMSLWAQEISDRGFEEVWNPNRTNEVSYHWERYHADRTQVQFTTGGYNRSDRYQLQINGLADSAIGICQNVYLSDTVAHKFYIYAKSAEATGTASIVLFDTTNQTKLFEKSININSADWQKTEFEIPAIAGHYKFNLAIIYQGVGTTYFDEVSLMPVNNFHGIRKEWETYLRIWRPGCLRYPGGAFVDWPSYKWLYGTGDIDQRKSAITFPNGTHGDYTQRMDLGIHEVITICRELDIEPVLVLNFSREPQEEANYVEYCNGDTSTFYGRLRAQNTGSIEPYGIKFWETENEGYFFYETVELISRIRQFATLMRAKDSSITIIANGSAYHEGHVDALFKGTGDLVDVFGIHPQGGAAGREILDDELWFLNMQNNASNMKANVSFYKNLFQNSPNTKLSCNEWWCHYEPWDIWLFDRDARNASLEAALWNAQMYLAFINNPEFMSYCARTMCIGMLRQYIYPDGRKTLYATPALFALAMLSQNRGDYLVGSQVECDTFEHYDWPNGWWITPTPYLDATTTQRGDTLFMAVVNRSPVASINADIRLAGTAIKPQCKVHELWSAHYLDYHTPDEPDKIQPTERDLTLDLLNDGHSFNYTFPKHSVTIITMVLEDTSIITPEPPSTAMAVSPMPADKSFMVLFDTNKHINNVKIYDMTGTLVWNNAYNFYSNSITISSLNLSQGAYRLVVTCSDGSYDTSLIISK